MSRRRKNPLARKSQPRPSRPKLADPKNQKGSASEALPQRVRLNKHIAASGLCSRRHADKLIEQGEVSVNGRVVKELGAQINPMRDRIRVSGADLPRSTKYYVLFHKPSGYITTRSDEKGRKTIYDKLPQKYASCDPAGRLDRETSGALILSNDGDFIHRVTHPSFHCPKVYRVVLDRDVSPKDLKTLISGIPLEPEGKTAQAEAVSLLEPKKVQMTLMSGYNRQIRRMFAYLNYEVKKLKRISVGVVALGSLPPGRTRMLTPVERRALLGPEGK